MADKSNFTLMATYNQAMNKNIFQAVSTLSTSELTENRGAFFGSILNTLNHILVGDIIWLQRFALHNNYSALDYVRCLAKPRALDSVLYLDFSLLEKKRVELDAVIVSFINQLTDNDIARPLGYQNTKGQLLTKNMGHVLQHFFNHQTHHRGQISTLLSQQNVDIGITDLLVSIPDAEPDKKV